MRLIAADELVRTIDKLSEDAGFYKPIYEGFSRAVKNQPTIDAVPVVRCRDCTYRADPMECPMCFEEYTDLSEDEWDSRIYDSTEEDGFCHCGKRKDGEG